MYSGCESISQLHSRAPQLAVIRMHSRREAAELLLMIPATNRGLFPAELSIRAVSISGKVASCVSSCGRSQLLHWSSILHALTNLPVASNHS